MAVVYQRVLGANGIDGILGGQYRKALENAWVWATLRCKKCNQPACVSKLVHSVSTDGVVTPSWICPHAWCGFHDWIRLDDWSLE